MGLSVIYEECSVGVLLEGPAKGDYQSAENFKNPILDNEEDENFKEKQTPTFIFKGVEFRKVEETGLMAKFHQDLKSVDQLIRDLQLKPKLLESLVFFVNLEESVLNPSQS
ncbi:hypothetical protein NDU88_001093 [Pleurodeles waltl]|uniref:Uncharacterized protein n=1 Tax=Pleurodeles waltl TaxID=8319 RepID=A0AAV7URU2_PLEWA|nr:hypothetical protein NDU88_001093 [Pleurodeles waltl]